MNNYNEVTDRVICPICNIELKSLSHHVRAHKLSLSEFKDMYPDARLVNDSYHTTMSNQQSSRVSQATLDYLDDLEKDHVECPICGDKRKSLSHHIRKHGLSKEEFLAQYPGYIMTANSTQKYHAELGRRTVKILNSDPDISEKRLRNFRKASKKYWDNLSDEQMEIIRDNMRNTQRIGTELYKSDESYRNRVRASKSKSALSRRESTSKMFSELWKDPEFISKMMKRKSYSSGLSELGYRSSYEDRMSIILDSLGITYKYEPFVLKYEHNGRTRLYTPDFYLPDHNLLLEIKPLSLLDSDMNHDKLVGSITLGYNFMFICEWELFNDSSNLSQVLSSSSTIETYSVSSEKYFLKGVE